MSSEANINIFATGYMVNATLAGCTADVKILQDVFAKRFQDSVWTTPADALHITLLDWLAPMVRYHKDKDQLINEILPEYDAALRSVLKGIDPIDVVFSRFIVSQSAIAIVGDDKSQAIFNKIREDFLSRIDLLPNTKLPPNIVHSTIIRFTDEIDVGEVKDFANTLKFSFTERIDTFRLVRETKLPMLDYSVLRTYPLNEVNT